MTTSLDEVLDLFKQVAQAQQETDRRLQQFVAENEKGFKQLRKEIGDLGGSWGRFVENMVAPACETLFIDRGIPVHRVSQRVRGRVGEETLEIDVLVTN